MRKNLLISILTAIVVKDLPIFVSGNILGKLIGITFITFIVLLYLEVFTDWIKRVRATKKAIQKINNMKLAIK